MLGSPISHLSFANTFAIRLTTRSQHVARVQTGVNQVIAYILQDTRSRPSQRGDRVSSQCHRPFS
eukprot:3732142-Pyramimonas_sp.AAC.1